VYLFLLLLITLIPWLKWWLPDLSIIKFIFFVEITSNLWGNTFKTLNCFPTAFYKVVLVFIDMCVCVSCSVVPDSVTPWTVATRLLCPWSSSGKNTGVGSHSLLQGVFRTQGLNLVSCIADRLLPKSVITLRITKWWYFNVIISSTFVCWHSYVKMSFSFFLSFLLFWMVLLSIPETLLLDYFLGFFP